MNDLDSSETSCLGTIGITIGDPAGVGPEVGMAALASGQLDARFHYEIIGHIPPDTQPGHPTASGAHAAIDALEEAVTGLRSGRFAAVATGPIAKHALQATGRFPHPGQTEFFSSAFSADDVCMTLTGRHLTVGLVTWHIPLAEVSQQLSVDSIVRAGRLLCQHIQERKGRQPRIAVAGLNPHAGEEGLLGSEEITTIAPAIAALRHEWPEVSGPYPPDTLFHRAAQGEFDAVLCMYHDQGLIPLKLLDFDNGVNITLGLPVLRTSPDHGTGYSIAGKGLAHATSMISAINLAAELAAQRMK